MSPAALHSGMAGIVWIISALIFAGCTATLTDVTVASPSVTLSCCDVVVDNPDCQEACGQLSLSSSAKVQLQQLTIVARKCSNTLTNFWQCINRTFPVVSDAAERWSGKTCCDLAQQTQCHNSCKKAKSRADLTHCRPNEQVPFFQCLERQEVSARCCGPATSSQCRATCKSLFWASTPSASDLENVREFCSPSIVACAENYTHTMFISPEEAVPCCALSSSTSCREICRQAMLSDLKDEEKYEMVTSECEEATLGTDLWNCLLMLSAKSDRTQYNHGGRIDLIGMDNAKLQCCTRALTNKCQQLCAKTYSNAWDRHFSEFLEECNNNPKEIELSLCITEVDQPCQMGCSGLSYCSNFNDRPMELFQSCNAQADMEARRTVDMWSSGTIIVPNYREQFLPIKDITKCRPHAWAAIACTLHIKPCQSRAPTSHICRSDCLSILNECIDTDRLSPDVSAESFCNLLSPLDVTAPCISMEAYLNESPYRLSISEITTPCNPNPCPDDEICVIRRKNCNLLGDPSCRQYQCKRACQMGEISSLLVPHKTFVKISQLNQEEVNVDCYRGCKCGHHNLILNCKDMGCVPPGDCGLRSGRMHTHNSQFNIGCNQCACYGGEMVCTQKTCLSTRANEAEMRAYTGLPCNCDSLYDPVCGTNGQTFPNQCVADCLDFVGSYIGGSCRSRDPCDNNPCSAGERCVPRRDVCIASKSHLCREYECVNSEGDCNRHSHEAACDVNDIEYPHVCALLQRGATFAHWGHCMSTCGRREPVCGMNGVQYTNECEAWSEGVYVDYYGNCRAVGQLLNLKSGESSCPSIQCPALPTGANCRPITTPGTCCPKCVGEIRVLWSVTQAADAARVSHSHQVTVRDVIGVVRMHISVLECDAFAYLSIERDLVVVIAPVTAHPTALQIQACMSEAEKIGSLISSRSPLIMMHLPTSAFVSATTRTSYVVLNGNSAVTLSPTHGLLLVVMCLLHSLVYR